MNGSPDAVNHDVFFDGNVSRRCKRNSPHRFRHKTKFKQNLNSLNLHCTQLFLIIASVCKHKRICTSTQSYRPHLLFPLCASSVYFFYKNKNAISLFSYHIYYVELKTMKECFWGFSLQAINALLLRVFWLISKYAQKCFFTPQM